MDFIAVIILFITWILNCLAFYFYDKKKETLAVLCAGPVAWFLYAIHLIKQITIEKRQEQFRSLLVDSRYNVYWVYPEDADYYKANYDLHWPNSYVVKKEKFDFDKWMKEYKKAKRESKKINWRYAPQFIWSKYEQFEED